jgi:fatty-acyl-CoA synthase
MLTLDVRIAAAARRSGGVTFVTGGDSTRVAWSELHRAASLRAGAMQARGIGPGSHIGILGPTTREQVILIEAVWLSGATLVMLPLPMRLGSIDEFASQCAARARQADLALVLADPELLPFVPVDADGPPVIAYGDLGEAPLAPVHVHPDSLAMLQFTSGSTAEPKGVMLPHRTVCANLDAIAEASALDADREVMVSWLPLYHDMGLVGFLALPMTVGCELVLGAPQDFMAAPERWLRWISDHGGTATAAPNFAWVLATRALRGARERFDLSRLRIALNGAEPIDPDAVDEFVAAARPHGLEPRALFPAFGMAEVVIGGTFPEPLAGLRVDEVDRHALENDRRAVPARGGDTRRFVRLGRPVPGLQARIVEPTTGAELGERLVGELELRGSSVTCGYYKRPDLQDSTFRDGWLRTGDLAYLIDGELVVCGRMKDVIIIGGRNVFPDEIERVAASVDGVRAGNVVAFGVDGRHGKESIVVVAECRADDATLVRKHIAERIRNAVGVPAKDIVLVDPGALPKTSSGKLQRGACRERYLCGLW